VKHEEEVSRDGKKWIEIVVEAMDFKRL